ncbi:DUF433 domain-containing protein [Caldithrix abyssi]|nr:DUF433 domain-containing protein [Caldithrix abyssi]
MNILELPRYTAANAGRLIGLRPERVRRWLHGYRYQYYPPENVPILIEKEPVIERGKSIGATHASFLDLIDLFFVKHFIERGFSLQKIRKALNEAREISGEHHFAHRAFFTDGSEIYLQIKDREDAALLQLLSGGQWVIVDIIKQLATQIDFQEGTGFAEKWYPLGKKNKIVIDPNICFGSPIIKGRGIRTENVFDLFTAEQGESKELSNWLNLTPKEIRAAVSFEKSLTIAA